MENLAAMNMKKTSTSAPAMAPATGIEYLHTFLAFVLFLHGPWNNEFVFRLHIKFIYSEKATKFCEISTVDLSYVVPVHSMFGQI